MIENEHLDSFSETRLSSVVHSTVFIDSIICTITIEKKLKTPAAHFIKNTAHDQGQVSTLQTRFQKAIPVLHYNYKLDTVKELSPPKLSTSLSASPSM